MAGQTKREGPWESNLGLEPEWDGASGLWECVDYSGIDEQKTKYRFSGVLQHDENGCYVRLLTKQNVYSEFSLLGMEQTPILWTGLIRRESDTLDQQVTAYGYVTQPTSPDPIGSLSEYHVVKLNPVWLIHGIHLNSIDEANWNNFALQTDILKNMLQSKEYGRGDSDTTVLQGEYQNTQISITFGNPFTFRDVFGFEKKSEIFVNLGSQFLPVYQFDKNIEISYPGSLAAWVDWVMSLLQTMSQKIAKDINVYLELSHRKRARLYYRLNLSKGDFGLPNTFSFKSDLSNNDFTELLEKWGLIMDKVDPWGYATHHMIRALRSYHGRLYTDEFLLQAEKVLESRWNAAHDNIETRTCFILNQLICKSKLAELLVKLTGVSDTFTSKNVAGVATVLRHEYTHPGTKSRRKYIRQYFQDHGHAAETTIALFLLATANVLLYQEVLNKYVVIDIPKKLHPGTGDCYELRLLRTQDIFWLVKEWPSLLEACLPDFPDNCEDKKVTLTALNRAAEQ